MKKRFLSAVLAVAAVLATSCGGEQKGSLITEGNTSKMDSLSYALGVNVASSVASQMNDIPFDFNAITEGLNEAAFDKSALTHDGAIEILRDYFMSKRPDRRAKVEKMRQMSDSVAIANGADPAIVASARQYLPADASMFESEEERKELSYAFGVDLGTNLKSADIPVQVYWISTALTDSNSGSPLMSEDEALAYLNWYYEEVRPAQVAAEITAKMDKIAKESGVKTTESGLMYRIERKGEELQATDDRDVVEVLYTGKLVRTGDIFDTNRFADRTPEQQEMMLERDPEAAVDKTIEFPLNRVIPGWTEGMKLVGKGGRISLWIPAELAYGSQGAGRAVGPNEALYFDVELVDVTPYSEEATEEEIAE